MNEFIVSPKIAKAINEIVEEEQMMLLGRSIRVSDWTKDKIDKEYEMIKLKKSKLSRSNRDKIVKIYEDEQ